ncbi:MAG: 5'-nucleotidase, partial [Vibrio metschnikovii]
GKLLPFAVPIGVYRLKGKSLAKALEGAINNALNNGVEGTGAGSYPYTHHLSFEYLPERPLGERIANLQIWQKGQWHPVQAEQEYWGTSSAYTMKGKEGYQGLTEMKGEGKITTISMADAFIEFLTDNPSILSNDAERQETGQYTR